MKQSGKIKISLDELRTLTRRALKKLGLSDMEQVIVEDVLMYAQLRGNNQNLTKIVEGTVRPDPSASEIRIARERGATLRLDGGRNLGMVVCLRACDEVARRATVHGIALVGTVNTHGSTGAIGYYAKRLAARGLVGIVMAGSPKVMAMHGGIDPVFGTNPIAIGVPADPPLVLDMATAAIAWFGLIEAKRRGETIDPGLALDANGQDTTDPAAALAGAVHAFGGYKGAGLAMMVEILTGPLMGAPVVGDGDSAGNRGCFFVAIDPAFLTDDKTFGAALEKLCSRVRGSRRSHDCGEILLPGERGRSNAERAVRQDLLELDNGLYRELRCMVEG